MWKSLGRSRCLLCFWSAIHSSTLAHAGQGDISSMLQSLTVVQEPSGFAPPATYTAAVPAAADTACNDSDRAVWTSRGQQAFVSHMDACGWKCWGQAACVKPCVMQRGAYSSACATCFGSFGQCASDRCPLECADAYSRKCRTCMEAHCAQAFTECTGFTPPEAFTVVLLGGPACVKSCVMQEEAYSDSCSACFGSLGQCKHDHCQLACTSNDILKCNACVDVHCPPALTESSGFSPALAEQGLAAADAAVACNDADRTVWNSTGRAAFINDVNSCCWKCWGRPPCVKSCIMQKQDYSDSCANCFGSLGKCARDNCRFKCRNAWSQWCESCMKAHCAQGFAECTGFN